VQSVVSTRAARQTSAKTAAECICTALRDIFSVLPWKIHCRPVPGAPAPSIEDARLRYARRSTAWDADYRRLPSMSLSEMSVAHGRLEGCSALRRVPVFSLNEICFDRATAVAKIAAQLGGAVDTAEVPQPLSGRRPIGRFRNGAALHGRRPRSNCARTARAGCRVIRRFV
jgi:hypothetical protein